MQYDLHTVTPLVSTKIVFFDIDGVLTPSADFVPGKSPSITKESIQVMKKFIEKDFLLVFITARSVNELRIKNGFEDMLKKHHLLEHCLLFGSSGLDQATYSYEFQLKNNLPTYKNNNIVLEKKPVIKRETFGNMDQFLLYKMLLGREIKQELKYLGFKIKPAMNEKLLNDARMFFQLENNNKKERAKAVKAAQQVIEKLREVFKTTGKFGSPVDLVASDIVAGISIEPIMLGKHFGVLRALKILGVRPQDKIIAYAFGDNDSDKKMAIRKDIKFIKVKSNPDFRKKAEQIISKY